MMRFKNCPVMFSLLFLAVPIVMFFSGCGESSNRAQSGQEEKMSQTSQSTDEEMKGPSTAPITEERTFYNFEEDLQGWEVPMWAKGKNDYVAKNVAVSGDFASKGEKSMKVECLFPGNIWTAGLVEIQQYLDINPWRVIRADIYIPETAPEGLKAKLILTVGNNWKFVEMNRSIPLIPGQWATITASIEPGSYDWKRVVPNEEFAKDVRKIAVRTESNRKPDYSGPIYVDNIRVGR